MSKVRKISIESNALAYGPMPKPEDEILQKLTINSQGRVWLKRYCFGHDACENTLISSEILFVGKEKAREILYAVEDYLDNEELFMGLYDVGNWDAEIVLESGETITRGDSLVSGNKKLDKISKMIRKALNDNTLFVFNREP